MTYRRQSATVHLLAAPVKISHIAARQDALQGALQGQAVLPAVQRPVEDVGTSPARQQQVQQSLQTASRAAVSTSTRTNVCV